MTQPNQSTTSPCPGCKTKPQKHRYRDERGWRCRRCAPPRRQCVYRDLGCPQTDIDNKCRKHERFFCRQRTACDVCWTAIDRETLSEHYVEDHQGITYRAGSVWTASRTAGRYCLLSGAPVSVVCWYKLDGEELELQVNIPVPSERLWKFKCTVKVVNVKNGQEKVLTPGPLYDEEFDWKVQVKEEDFDKWSKLFDVSVEIEKI